MKVLGIIPARGGSKGIPKKNLKILCGKPLIAYTFEEAKKSALSKIVVSTDSAEIAECAQSYGIDVCLRPLELAQDSSATLDALKYTVSKGYQDYDAVMTLQPTSPLRTFLHINEAIHLFKSTPGADSLVSVVRVPHSFMPEKLMELKEGYLVGDFSPRMRQHVDIRYARNGAAIYITKMDNLKNYILGGNVLAYKMSKISSIDIDDLEDWEIVERLLR